MNEDSMKRSLKLFISLFFICAFSSAQFSEDALRYSLRGSGVGSRAFGMGNAYIGVSDDYTATVWNPAGLAQMRRLEFTGGISNVGYSNTASFGSTSLTADNTATSLDNFGFVFPFPTVRGSLVFAFGFNRLADYASALSFKGFNGQSSIIPTLYDADASYDIPFNTYLSNTSGYTAIQKNVNQRGEIKEGGSLGQWSFSGAVDVEENISFGVSLNIATGSYNYVRNYVEEDVNNVYNDASPNLPADSAYLRFNKFYYDSYLNSELTGGGFTFGAMYRSELFRVGLVAKAPTSITVKETYSNAGESVFDAAGGWQSNAPPRTTKYSYDATNEYGVSSPWTFGVGASWYVIPQVLVAADIEYSDWSQIEWTDNPKLERRNVQLQANFRPTTSYRIGAEVDVPGTDVRVRGGYSLTPSPYKKDPSSFDQALLTAGAGILLQRNVVIDGAIAFGSFKSYRNQYSFPGLINAARTDESVSTTNVNVTLSYRF